MPMEKQSLLKNKESIRYMPKQVCISMKQGSAPLAKAIVQEGQYVCCGQLIGQSDSEEFCVYASISGKINRIFKERISPKEIAEYVVIDRYDHGICTPVRSMEINREKFKKLGIITTLGKNESFFNYCEQIPIKNTLNLLAFDREPGQYADYRLLMECTSKIILGAKGLADIYNIHQLNIYITSEEVSHILKKHIRRFLKTLSPLKTFYIYAVTKNPYEQQYYLTKKEGIWCTPTDLCKVYSGFFDDIPSTTCMMTVSGRVAHPGNYEVPNGTYVRELLDYCGMHDEADAWVVGGGVMGGHCVSVEKTAVSLKMQSLCVIRAKIRSELPCVRCGRCKKVCPSGLNPVKIQKYSSSEVQNCVECGLCSYVCPSNRSLKEHVKAVKTQGGLKTPKENGNYIELDEEMVSKLEPLTITSQSGPYIHSALDTKSVFNYAVLSTGIILMLCACFLNGLYFAGTALGTVLLYGASVFKGKNNVWLWKKSFLISAVSVITIGSIMGGVWWMTVVLWGNIIACILKVYIL